MEDANIVIESKLVSHVYLEVLPFKHLPCTFMYSDDGDTLILVL